MKSKGKNFSRLPVSFAPFPLEGGLVKKGELREGAHTAHVNHRSKTICPMRIECTNPYIYPTNSFRYMVTVRRVGPLPELPLLN
jgi:hypothetical protein